MLQECSVVLVVRDQLVRDYQLFLASCPGACITWQVSSREAVLAFAFTLGREPDSPPLQARLLFVFVLGFTSLK